MEFLVQFFSFKFSFRCKINEWPFIWKPTIKSKTKIKRLMMIIIRMESGARYKHLCEISKSDRIYRTRQFNY